MGKFRTVGTCVESQEWLLKGKDKGNNANDLKGKWMGRWCGKSRTDIMGGSR